MEKSQATLANFNCTMNINGKSEPMLNFFESIILQALLDKSLYRENSSGKYYIGDLKLIQLENGPIALVGKHVRKTKVTKWPDYNRESDSFIGESLQLNSSPHADFILLLHNHRLIYHTNQSGTPPVASFGTTIKVIVNKFVTAIRKDLIKQLNEVTQSEAKKNNITYINENTGKTGYYRYEFNGIYYKNLSDFKHNYLDKFIPFPQINVVPIESESLIKEAFSKIDKIKSVEFRCYKLNNEAFDPDDIFASMNIILDRTESNSVKNVLVSPNNIPIVENALYHSKGKSSYIVNAVTDEGEKIKILPESVAEKVSVEINSQGDIVYNSNLVYNQLKQRTSLREVSEENLNVYRNKLDSLLQLLK